MSEPRRVIGYARVSSAEQALGTSLRDQQDSIRRYAEARGLTVSAFFVEAESSIREKIERRVQMASLLRDVRRGDLVVCDKLDRWSRDPEFTYGSVRKILEAGASFYAVSDRVDPSTSEGDTALGFRILFAREEHKRIKERTVGTRNILRQQGYFASGVAPLGYRRPSNPTNRLARNVLEIVPEEAETVRAIFREVVSESTTKLAARYGMKVCYVKEILHRRTYLGEVPVGPKRSNQWVRGQHAPIIDEATWQRAHEALAARSSGGPRPRNRATSATRDWLLRDRAYCAFCRRYKMTYARGGKGHTYYRCHQSCAGFRSAGYVPSKSVEEDVRGIVLARLEGLRAELQSAVPGRAGGGRSPAPTTARARLLRKRERHVELYADGRVTIEALRASLDKVDAELAALDRVDEEAPRLADPGARKHLLAHLTALRYAMTEATPEEARGIVNALARAVYLAKGREPEYVWRTAEELAGNAGS